jgi:hypothetical protein
MKSEVNVLENVLEGNKQQDAVTMVHDVWIADMRRTPHIWDAFLHTKYQYTGTLFHGNTKLTLDDICFWLQKSEFSKNTSI